MFSAGSFYASTQAFCMWYHYVTSFVDGVVTVACWFLGTVAAFICMVWSTDFVLYPAQSACWIFTADQDFLEMFLQLL